MPALLPSTARSKRSSLTRNAFSSASLVRSMRRESAMPAIDERARGEYQRDFENSLRPPRRLAERAGERDLQRSKPPVGVIDPRENRVERGRLVVAGDDVARGGPARRH